MPILLALLPFWNGLKAFIGAAFTFLTTKPGVYLLIAACAAGAYWYSGHEGYKRAQADDAAAAKLAIAQAETAAANKARKDQIALDKGIAAAADKATVQVAKARTITLTITKEVPTYVPVEVDRTFPVPCGLVRLHDAAAIGVDPETLSNPAGLADDAACTLKASDLASVIVENYGIDHEKDAQIIGLQDLARTLKATIEGTDHVGAD